MQERPSAPSDRLREWALVALVFGLVLLCYWPALQGAMLWDDFGHVTRPDLRSWAGLIRIWSDVSATQQFYPVLHSAFWLEHRLWGDATLGYHLVNVFVHASSCCLLAFLLRRLWTAPAGVEDKFPIPVGTEWFVALLFAVHPVGVESVAWISEQKNTLSLFFYLASAWMYLDFSAERRVRSYVGATVLFLLCLGTKSVTATLPAALLVVLWWRNGKLAWRRDVGPLLPWLIVAFVAGLFTAWVERKLIGAEGVDFELSLLQRGLLAGRVIWFYLGKLVWPVDLAFFYERWKVPAQALGWVGYLVATIAVTVLAWSMRFRSRGLMAGWLLFVGSLFPALGFFNVYPFVFSYVADHFQYLASLGFFTTLVGSIARVAAASPRWGRTLLAGFGAVLIVGLVVLSNRQSRLYVNDETLFRATVARQPKSWMAHHILGFALAMIPTGREEAMAEYREALRLNPDYPDAHTGLAIELMKTPGHEAEAIAHYEKAIELKPGAADAHNNLGLLLSADPARAAEAARHFESALRIKPEFPEAEANFAGLLAKLPGRLNEALSHYEKALKLRPDAPEIHDGFANALSRSPGREVEAFNEYEIALRLNPDLAEAHLDFANFLSTSPERRAEAVGHYETAVRLNPGLVEAHYNLANTLVKLPGRAAEAIAPYEAALQLRPDFADAHANLANVLAESPGRQQEAIIHYEAALHLKPEIAWVHLALALQLSAMPGREGEAAFQAGEALRIRPDYAEAHNCLALLDIQQRRWEKAKEHWERALQINPNYAPARENLRLLEQMMQQRPGNP